MTIKSTSLFFVSILLLSTSSWALQPNQKRLLLDRKSKQCFFMESIRKSDKYGWLNEKKAKHISQIKRKKVISSTSPVQVRKVIVPKAWCQNS